MEKNQFSTKGKTIVDMQNRTLRYVLEGQYVGVTTGPMAIDRLRYWQVDWQHADADDQGRRRQAAVGREVAEAVGRSLACWTS